MKTLFFILMEILFTEEPSKLVQDHNFVVMELLNGVRIWYRLMLLCHIQLQVYKLLCLQLSIKLSLLFHGVSITSSSTLKNALRDVRFAQDQMLHNA